MSEEKSKSRLELNIELLKALAWPLFALIILFSFWTPLRDSAKELPRLMRDAESVSIYSFSIKVKTDLRQQTTPEVGKVLATPEVERVLARLSPDGIQKLLNSRFVSCWESGKDNIQQVKEMNKELMQLGLLQELPDMGSCLKNQGANYEYAVGPTDLGKATQEFIFAFVTQSARELASAPPPRD
jgi:hypothetical protein